MDTLSFLAYRIGFLDMPPGELRAALDRIEAGLSWEESFEQTACSLGRLARRAERAGRLVSATEAWVWTAAACQVASLGLHFAPTSRWLAERTLKLRRIARLAYRRALHLAPWLGEAVSLPAAGMEVRGYLRRPGAERAPAVVLVNGLDSLCEAELHAFGNRMLARGLAVLALDLPAAFGARSRVPRHRLEELAPAIADWLAARSVPLCGAFGVSFGGYLVARMLAGDPRFAAGVAVSPAAWLGDRQLAVERFRAMLRLAFDLSGDDEVTSLAAAVDLHGLAAPAGRLLVYQMEQDALFGREHGEALCAWSAGSASLRSVAAEHVGTSRIHCWLPEACDWLRDQLIRPALEGRMS